MMLRRLLLALFVWLHRRVLALYPRRFRTRFGGPMNAAMADALSARAREAGASTLVVDGARAIGDAIGGIAPARAGDARERLLWPTPTPVPLSRRVASVADSVVVDGRLAARTLRRSPLFTVSTIAALAVGLGAATAIYAVVRGVLWQPLPYHEPDRLVMIWSDNVREQKPRNPISAADFRDLTQGARSLHGAEALLSFLLAMRVGSESGIEIAQVSAVTPGTFTLLGRAPQLGRPFTASDRGVAIISHQYWLRRFGGDPAVIGRTIPILDRLNDVGPTPPAPLRVIGVMPRDFAFPYRTMLGPTALARASDVDLWLPLAFEGPWLTSPSGLVRHVRPLGVVARLAPGATVDAARAELAARARQVEAAWPAINAGWGATVVPLHEQAVGDVEPMLLGLFAGAIVLLTMTGVNLANLLLARGVGRAGDAAVRVALGADRGRLVQQALTEGVVLSLIGGAAALLVARWGIAILQALAPPGVPRFADVALDGGVVGFALGAAASLGLVLGAASAMAAMGVRAPLALRSAGRGAIGAGRGGARAALVVAEVALAVVLTIGAGLLGRSFVSLLDVHPGFTPESLLTLQVNLPDAVDTPAKRVAYYDRVFERIEAIPGVRAAGGTTRLPLGSTSVTTEITVEGRDPREARPEAEMRRALHDYFPAMQIPLLEGRLFERADATGQPVAIVNRTLARRLFGSASAVGRRLRMGTLSGPGPWLTIVGVVGDIRHLGLEIEPAPEIYISHRQGAPGSAFLAVRVDGNPAAATAAVRAAVLGVDAGATIFGVRTMQEVRSASVGDRRFAMSLAGLFGGLALVLAGLGVYGVMALIVAERRPEVGVRLALGARPLEIFALILRQSWRLAAIGVGLGLGGAALLAPALRAQLYGVPPLDPVTFVGAAIVLFAVAGAAAVVPARGAMRVDPIATLRGDGR
jgi:putative ABC transport system permease protein